MEKNRGFEKKSLINLINIIDEILKYPENEWFAEKLFQLLGSYFNDNSLYNNSILNNLSAAISQDILKKQAQDFYRNANLTPKTKKECENDFILMEYAKRNDKFEQFGLSLFQQIEGIVGEWILLDSSLNRLKEIIDKPFLTKFNRDTKKYNKEGFESGTNLIKKKVNSNFLTNDEIADLINDKKFNPIHNISIKDRLRIFTYISVFKEEVFVKNIFDDFVDKLVDIYRVRNLAHRPKANSFYEGDKKKVAKSINNRHFNYMVYYEVLYKVVNSISQKKTSEKIDFKKLITKFGNDSKEKMK